ncbi:MAG TPA: alpha/beta hydrolase, partial [Vicinamibacteria bacterium]
MKPLFFGSSQKPLFGLHTPPTGESGGRSAVVLCAPVGQEYMRSHRTLRELAGRLSQSGFHVLRFDYYGCGDSGGTALEGDLDQWTSDVGAAIDEARDGSGLDRVSLVGLRLGAALAARASVRRTDLDRVVFWEPVVDGRGHLEEQLDLHRT